LRVALNRPLQFRVAALAGGAALVGDAVDVGAAATALPDVQLAGGDQAGTQLTHPLRGDVEPMRQAVDAELEGLPSMPVDVQGDVRQEVVGGTLDLGVVADVEEAVNVRGTPPPRTRGVG
jgi:hypothetical protein